MTQKEFSDKYAVPQPEVCTATWRYSLPYTPRIGKSKDFNERDLVDAVVQLYVDRSNDHLKRARLFSDKAQRILDIEKGGK